MWKTFPFALWETKMVTNIGIETTKKEKNDFAYLSLLLILAPCLFIKAATFFWVAAYFPKIA